LPPCGDSNSICISILNETIIDVDAALYLHNGFDPGPPFDYLFLHRTDRDAGTSAQLGRVVCENWTVGEMKLPFEQLVAAPNLATEFPASSSVYTLAPGASIVVPVRCNQVKSIACAAATSGSGAVLTNPDDVEGPAYRCMTSCPTLFPRDCDEVVPCGATIEFLIRDVNAGVNAAAVVLFIEDITFERVSGTCSTYCDDACRERTVQREGECALLEEETNTTP
jgi:hypothetical protein